MNEEINLTRKSICKPVKLIKILDVTLTVHSILTGNQTKNTKKYCFKDRNARSRQSVGDEKKRRAAEEEKKVIEEEKRRIEEEKRRIEEERRRIEEEERRRGEEARVSKR